MPEIVSEIFIRVKLELHLRVPVQSGPDDLLQGLAFDLVRTLLQAIPELLQSGNFRSIIGHERKASRVGRGHGSSQRMRREGRVVVWTESVRVKKDDGLFDGDHTKAHTNRISLLLLFLSFNLGRGTFDALLLQ